MILAGLGARRRGGEWVWDETDTTPYAMPTSAPYHPPPADFAITPTYDGSGQAIHPGVLDFRQITGRPWNGWRYWMVMTPWPERQNALENPSILVSNDGYTWQVPAGLTNPVRATTDGGWASDPDLEYDAATDELVLMWRPIKSIQRTIRSGDGVTWYGDTNCTRVLPYAGVELLSPSIIRHDDGTWDIWVVVYDDRNLWRYTTTDLSNWGTGTPSTGITGYGMWHVDVAFVGGRYLAIFNGTGGILVASSPDGLAWTVNPTPVFQQTNYVRHQPYRTALTPHENGTHMRCWVSTATNTVTVWRTYYIHVPIAEWPAPPA